MLRIGFKYTGNNFKYVYCCRNSFKSKIVLEDIAQKD